MISLFTTARPFHGHVAIIQRNAIRSWMALCPPCEILLLGDDDGTADLAREWGLRYVSEIERNEFGTPLISSLFETAQETAKFQLLCQINADVMLTNDFLPAVRALASRKKPFLAAGQRWDVDIVEPWNFDSANWQEDLRELATKTGSLHPATGLDYFIFPKGAFKKLPPFAIGRRILDNWLLFQARRLSMPVIDSTHVITAIHQNHGYEFHPGGESAIMEGVEAQRNLEFAGGWGNILSLKDATHILITKDSHFAPGRVRLRRNWRTLPFPLLTVRNHLGYFSSVALRALKRRILPSIQDS